MRHESAGGHLREGTSWERLALLRERVLVRPLLAIFVLAFGARLVSAIALWAFADSSLYEDDALYTRMAVDVARDRTDTWDDYTHWLYGRTRTVLIPLSILHRIFGTSALVGQVTMALVGAGVAVLAGRLIWRAAGLPAALTTGVLVGVLPSQVVLSSLMLKDAAVWLILVGLALVLARERERTTAGAAVVPAVTAALLFLLAYIRLHTFVTACIAVVVVAVLVGRYHRPERTVGLLMAAIVVPIGIGIGPLGVKFITSNAGSLEDIRSSNAHGETAIGAATTTTLPLPSDTVPGATTSPTTVAVPADDGEGLDGSSVRYLPRGVTAILFEPAPWRSEGSTSLRLAQAESVLWYPLLGLAAVGLWQVRRRVRTLAFPVVVGAGTLLMWGLVEGNIGTAYRHRGEFAWVVCCLAGLGVIALVQRRSGRPLLRP